MSRFWPHTSYAEDQPLSHTILWTHVLTRAVTAGSIVGSGIGTSIVLLRNFNIIKQRIPPSSFATTILRSSGTGVVIATGLLCIALPMRMYGKEEIEWNDRSWRLIENRGQVECDDWTYPGMTAGAVAFAMKGQGLGWRSAVGSIGLGSVGGMLGYMGWRYGVKGGKFEETTL
ncbi:hypothetical protein EG329_012545 [Mollisiaceae sp. DMI_Dod_QoI]|nr:hypothetical protein EG329_012545 [Helotiales sp. DMI_Dod_QoI]